jgi:hypothetical protein
VDDNSGEAAALKKTTEPFSTAVIGEENEKITTEEDVDEADDITGVTAALKKTTEPISNVVNDEADEISFGLEKRAVAKSNECVSITDKDGSAPGKFPRHLTPSPLFPAYFYHYSTRIGLDPHDHRIHFRVHEQLRNG